MSKIIIDIADDHNVVLTGLDNILREFPSMEVRNLYSSGMALLNGLASHQPDVLLLDIQMPDVTGEELAPLISKSYPDVRILVMTGFDNTYYARSMLQKGALGYLLKNASETVLKQAIETVYEGNQFVDPSLREKLIKDLVNPHSQGTPKPVLTRREKQVLKLIMQEQTSAQIAAGLKLSLRTVENQRVNIMQKLMVKNAVGLVKKTIELGLLD